MKCSELIEMLKKCSPDSTIVISVDGIQAIEFNVTQPDRNTVFIRDQHYIRSHPMKSSIGKM